MPLPLDELVAQPSLVNLRAQESDWDELLFEYELALDDMQAWLRGLNDAQIHFKPADQKFSIAEIVTHSCVSDELFWGWLALLVQGRGAEIDPETLIGGAGARNDVSLLDLQGSNEACRTLGRNTIGTLPDPADPAATAPHPYFGALNAKGWIYFMALHRGMHRRQCEQVIDAPGFPRSASLQTQPREVYQPAARKTWLAKGAEGKQPKASGKHRVTAKKRTAAKKAAAKKRTSTKSSKK
jgi:DinB superfamily